MERSRGRRKEVELIAISKKNKKNKNNLLVVLVRLHIANTMKHELEGTC